MKKNIGEPVLRIFFINPYYTFYWNETTGDVKIVSNSSIAKGKALAKNINSNGYFSFKVGNKHLLPHQFVGEKLFGPKKEGFVINHKDCNKLNNSKINLEYVTIAENIQHSVRSGRHVSCDPTRHGNYKDGRALKENQTIYQRSWQRQKLGVKSENFRK